RIRCLAYSATGRLQFLGIIFRDENGAYYHLEEQRNPRKPDFYRSAAYHFFAGQQWGKNITDIILVSGDVQIGNAEIKTKSGHYYPIIIDLSARDGYKRLEEIQEATRQDEFQDWLELVFLPLYGKETGDKRSKFVKQILHFESALCKTNKLAPTLLAATLVMSNKFIDKKDLTAIWEEIKMLDILEIAREKGIEEGKFLGIEEGKFLGIEEGKFLGIEEGKLIGLEEGKNIGKNLGMLENSQEMLVDALFERFNHTPGHILQQIRTIQNRDILKIIFRKIFRCTDIKEFEETLNQIMS
ncbi:MAG: hypothetical protein HN417_12385, partial [Desulfobacula sp.]|nr:hypothetical protein [Desulfobacula sp.]